jgi:chemotaxis signal transduction protein
LSTWNRVEDIRLFRFRVDGVDCDLAIPAQWTAGVAQLPFVTPIPFAPPSIYGISRWQDKPVSIVDLRMLLQADGNTTVGHASGGYHLIARAPSVGGEGLVGWPIKAGADTLRVAAQMPPAVIPAGIKEGAIHAAVAIGDAPLLLLDLVRLFTAVESY